MSLSVGTIESYIPDSTEFEQTQYSDLGDQGREALTLSDSNLWLVDSTNLNQVDANELSLITPDFTNFMDDQQGYLAPMSSTSMYSTLGDITVYGNDLTADSILYTSNPSLQLSSGAPLAEVQSDSQSSSTSLLSSGDSSLSTSTPDRFSSSNGSGTPTSSTGLSGLTPITSSDDSATDITSPPIDDSITSTDGSSGTPTDSSSISITEPPDDISKVPLESSSISITEPPDDIKEVPFELHSVLGLLIVAAIVLIRQRPLRRQISTIKPV